MNNDPGIVPSWHTAEDKSASHGMCVSNKLGFDLGCWQCFGIISTNELLWQVFALCHR
mgnify:FL=1